MGIFSQNYRPGFNNYTVEAAEGYGGPGADSKIMLECYQNDMALFEGLISSDFHAAYAAINGSVTESTVITEGAIGDFFKKIKEMFLKLIEKIKGLVKSFMTKFVAVFIKDNKELVKKYHKQVMANLNDKTKKMNEMTFKMHKNVYESDYINIITIKDFDLLYDKTMKETRGITDAQKFNDMKDTLEEETINDLNKILDENITSLSELRASAIKSSLGEEEEFEGYTSKLNTFIEKTLSESSTTLKSAKSAQDEAERKCKKVVNSAESEQKKASNLKNGELLYMYDSTQASAYTALMYKAATLDQQVVTSLMGAQLEALKVALKDCRAVYIKAAARRAVREDALLFDMIDEASNYEVDTMFESEDYKDVPEEEVESDINQVVDDIADERCR